MEAYGTSQASTQHSGQRSQPCHVCVSMRQDTQHIIMRVVVDLRGPDRAKATHKLVTQQRLQIYLGAHHPPLPLPQTTHAFEPRPQPAVQRHACMRTSRNPCRPRAGQGIWQRMSAGIGIGLCADPKNLCKQACPANTPPPPANTTPGGLARCGRGWRVGRMRAGLLRMRQSQA